MTQPQESSTVRPPQKPGRFPKWLAIGGAIFVGVPLASFALDAHTFGQAEQAYERADCEQAIARYTGLVERWRPVDWDDYEVRSQSRIGECNDYQTARPALEGTAAESLVAASLFLDRYPNSALPVREAVATRLEGTTPESLASVELCDVMPSVATHNLLPAPEQAIPMLHYGCGQAYQAAGRHTDAVTLLQQFLSDYPGHEQTSAVEVALAAAMFDEARANNAGQLPSPGVSGRANAGSTQVEIRNDSPEPMRIIFSGAETRFEELPGCEDCTVFRGNVPDACPEQGPVATYTLKPGDYQVLVRSIGDTSVTPFTGEWKLEDGYIYSNCFYVVEGPA